MIMYCVDRRGRLTACEMGAPPPGYEIAPHWYPTPRAAVDARLSELLAEADDARGRSKEAEDACADFRASDVYREHGPGLAEALAAVREAGGKDRDRVEDPEALLRGEGDDAGGWRPGPPPAPAEAPDGVA